jgi:hypothetical protein
MTSSRQLHFGAMQLFAGDHAEQCFTYLVLGPVGTHNRITIRFRNFMCLRALKEGLLFVERRGLTVAFGPAVISVRSQNTVFFKNYDTISSFRYSVGICFHSLFQHDEVQIFVI